MVKNPSDEAYAQRLLIPCPGEIFEKVHPQHSRSEPFYTYPMVPDGEGVNHSRQDSLESREKLMRFDAADNVFVLIAHDSSVLDVIEQFPKSANDWKAKNWKEQCKWRFLQDFTGDVKD
jgi:hypothetical protein